jgi:hypothetical protein
MLEIILLVVLSIQISKMTKAKGRNPVGWILMLIGLWVGGEILGALVGVFGSLMLSGGDEPNLAVALVGAVIGAATGAIITFSVVKSLAPLRRDDDEYWEAPESGGYRDKFDAGKYGDRLDADKYRPKGGEDADRSPEDKEAYRAKPDEG